MGARKSSKRTKSAYKIKIKNIRAEFKREIRIIDPIYKDPLVKEKPLYPPRPTQFGEVSDGQIIVSDDTGIAVGKTNASCVNYRYMAKSPSKTAPCQLAKIFILQTRATKPLQIANSNPHPLQQHQLLTLWKNTWTYDGPKQKIYHAIDEAIRRAQIEWETARWKIRKTPVRIII